jgi:SAM-dependent methyltransferase
METKSFNKLDELIANWRLSKVKKYITKGDAVLDFGCGYQAYFLNNIKNEISKGVGIDSDIEAHSINGNIELVKFNYEARLPFEDNSFNKIFLLAVYEHIPLDKTIPLLLELKRILKPNGKIILTIPTPNGKPVLEFMAYKLRVISIVQIADHVKYYAKEDMVEDAQKAGLKLTYHEYFQLGWNSMQVLEK